MKRTLLKKLICCLFIAPSLVIIAGLSSCNPDLGKYDSEDGLNDFLDDIDDLKGLYESKKNDNEFEFKSDTYDLEDSITNEYIMQYLACEDSSKQVPFKKFVYIVIPFKSDLKIESLSLYVKANSTTEVKLSFSAFYFKDSGSCPDKDKLRKMNDADVGIYSDPPKENSVASASLSVGNYYDGFVLSGFHQTVDIGESYVTENCLCVKKNSYLYLRVENNSALNKTTMQPVDISFINLLIRAL
jgi:hypothetical protein